MKINTPAIVLLLGLSLPMAGIAAEPEHDHNHVEAPDAAIKAPLPAPLQDQMQRMQALHDRMMAARTPAERRQLMQDNIKLMQEGMALMKAMGKSGGRGGMMDRKSVMQGQEGSDGMSMCMEMKCDMKARMDMMEMMMQLMLDQQSAALAK